jgi:hypothetical protein
MSCTFSWLHMKFSVDQHHKLKIARVNAHSLVLQPHIQPELRCHTLTPSDRPFTRYTRPLNSVHPPLSTLVTHPTCTLPSLLTHPTPTALQHMARTRRTRPRASLSSSKQRVLTTKRRLERRKSAPCSCWLRFSLVGGLQKHHCSRYRVHAFFFPPLSRALFSSRLLQNHFCCFPLLRGLQVLFKQLHPP